MSSMKVQGKKKSAPNTSSRLPAFFLRTLLFSYYPFLVVIVGLSVGAIAWLLLKAEGFLIPFLALPALVLLLTLLQLLWALRVLFRRIKDVNDEMELRVSREMAPQLYDWVRSIAEQRGLPTPDDIRVSADTVAHIYQRGNGRHVLVFGAIAVRALPQPSWQALLPTSWVTSAPATPPWAAAVCAARWSCCNSSTRSISIATFFCAAVACAGWRLPWPTWAPCSTPPSGHCASTTCSMRWHGPPIAGNANTPPTARK